MATEVRDGVTERAAIVAWLRSEAQTCDCFAREAGECACGAWDAGERSYKEMRVEDLADAIERGDHITNSTRLATQGEVIEVLATLEKAEREYRKAHDLHGDGSSEAGRAWDLLRRAGDRARTALLSANTEQEKS